MSGLSPTTEDVERPSMDGVILQRRKNTMTSCLRPLLASMRLFGLYFVRQSEGSSDEKSCKCNALMIYGILIVTILWLNVARNFSVFTKDDDKFGLILLNKLLAVIWVIQCAVSQTSIYATCHSGTLQKVFMRMKLADICACYLRRMAIVYTISAWSVIAICSSVFAYGLFVSGGFMDYALAPIASHVSIPDNLLIIPRIGQYILSFYLLAAYIFPQAMTHLLAMLLSFQFTHVSQELDRSLESQDGQVGDADIEMIRNQHQEISMSVSHIDNCLMFSNASAFCCQLCCFIIVLYTVIFYHSLMNDTILIGIHVFWIVLMTTGLAFTIAGGIRINHYVSRSLLRCYVSLRSHVRDSMNPATGIGVLQESYGDVTVMVAGCNHYCNTHVDSAFHSLSLSPSSLLYAQGRVKNKKIKNTSNTQSLKNTKDKHTHRIKNAVA